MCGRRQDRFHGPKQKRAQNTPPVAVPPKHNVHFGPPPPHPLMLEHEDTSEHLPPPLQHLSHPMSPNASSDRYRNPNVLHIRSNALIQQVSTWFYFNLFDLMAKYAPPSFYRTVQTFATILTKLLTFVCTTIVILLLGIIPICYLIGWSLLQTVTVLKDLGTTVIKMVLTTMEELLYQLKKSYTDEKCASSQKNMDYYMTIKQTSTQSQPQKYYLESPFHNGLDRILAAYSDPSILSLYQNNVVVGVFPKLPGPFILLEHLVLLPAVLCSSFLFSCVSSFLSIIKHVSPLLRYVFRLAHSTPFSITAFCRFPFDCVIFLFRSSHNHSFYLRWIFRRYYAIFCLENCCTPLNGHWIVRKKLLRRFWFKLKHKPKPAVAPRKAQRIERRRIAERLLLSQYAEEKVKARNQKTFVPTSLKDRYTSTQAPHHHSELNLSAYLKYRFNIPHLSGSDDDSTSSSLSTSSTDSTKSKQRSKNKTELSTTKFLKNEAKELENIEMKLWLADSSDWSDVSLSITADDESLDSEDEKIIDEHQAWNSYTGEANELPLPSIDAEMVIHDLGICPHEWELDNEGTDFLEHVFNTNETKRLNLQHRELRKNVTGMEILQSLSIACCGKQHCIFHKKLHKSLRKETPRQSPPKHEQPTLKKNGNHYHINTDQDLVEIRVDYTPVSAIVCFLLACIDSPINVGSAEGVEKWKRANNFEGEEVQMLCGQNTSLFMSQGKERVALWLTDKIEGERLVNGVIDEVRFLHSKAWLKYKQIIRKKRRLEKQEKTVKSPFLVEQIKTVLGLVMGIVHLMWVCVFPSTDPLRRLFRRFLDTIFTFTDTLQCIFRAHLTAYGPPLNLTTFLSDYHMYNLVHNFYPSPATSASDTMRDMAAYGAYPHFVEADVFGPKRGGLRVVRKKCGQKKTTEEKETTLQQSEKKKLWFVEFWVKDVELKM
ncbi:hypothetical protein BLNAU_1354 [Blattamonas nauphoetae]|uniref:Uncharacterized protein n=1 Tax=Blattamonas nauphoetae TaxID=2049346 RepID=A0ABQ9YJ47_9EUKA|nr:hypothetical protein BLNAU_1354 [Blattamonas nauphoetae]